MAVELPDDFDINQLDMADPATREFAKTLVDLDDPATKQWWDSTSPVRSAGTRFGDLVSKAAVSGPFGTMTVYAQDWMDSGKNLLKERFPGKSEEWYEDRTDRLLAENYKATVQEYEDKGKNDPYWKAEDSFLNNLGRAGLTIAGTVAGSGSPIDLAAPGASRVGKVAWQGALNAGEEVVNQAGQLGKDLRDSFSPGDVVMAGITGTALPALFETTGFVKDLFKGRGVDTTPGADPRMTDEVEEGLKDLYKTGTFEEIADYQIKHGFTTDLGELGEFVRQRDEGAAVSDAVLYADQLKKEAEDFTNRPQPEPTPLEQEAAAFKSKPEPTVEDVFPTDESLAAKSKAMEEKLAAERDAFLNRDKTDSIEAKPVEAEAPKVVPEDVQAKIDQTDADIADLTKDWQNAPSYKTYENFDDLKGVDNDAIGAILDDGQVVINLSKIDTPETLKAVVFHEGLGHHGLTQKFGDDLDDTLTNFYNNSTDFRADVDAWIKDNPGAYADSPNLVARAADEVLAKMSEKGPLPVAFVDKLKNMLKDFARKARLKGVEYSDREIRTILGMAHDAVIKGKPGGVRGNGFRYSKLKDEKELGTDDQFTYDDGRPPEQIKTYTTEEVRQKLFEKTGKRYMKSANDNIRPRASAPTPPRSGAGDEDWVEYHRKSAEFYQQKADHYQAKGKDRYAETARQQSASHLRSADRRSGLDTSKSGAAYHRQSADYYERAAKRYFDRGNAERGKFYQSMAAEARKLAKGYAEEALTARYMKKPTVSRSEKSSNPDRFSLNMAETVAPKGETAKTFLKELEVYNNYELKNLSTDEAIKAAERLGIDKEWVKYFNDRRLGVQTPQPDMSRYLPKVKYMKSLSPEKMRTTNDVEDLLDFLAEENLKVKADPTTNAETIRQAEDMGLTVGKYLKTKGLDEQGVAARLKAAHQLITNQLDDLEGLRVRADKEQMSPSLYAQIKEKLAIVQAVYAKFDADAGETGRALQILKDISQSKKSASAAAKFMRDSEGVDITSDPEALIRLLNNMSAIRQVEGTEAAAKHFRKTREAKAEDYIGSVVYNFMLSSPKTWIVNALGSPFNFLNDLVVDGISSMAGQALRLSKNADRVYGREIAARIYGPIVAFQQYKTWKNIFDAFATGQGRSGSTLGKTGQRGLVMPGALTTIETPQRIMAGIDEFWANFLQMSNLYGEAAHESAKAGLKGKAFWANAAEKVENPTEELLAAASKKTNKQLFRDTPSKWGQKIIDAQTPRYEDTVEIKMVQDPDTGKMRPTAKTTRPKSTTPERVGKFVAKTVVPFVPTLDSIARTLIRNSGPVALFSKEIRKDLMTKGVTRQSAIARISLSSAVLAFWAAKAAQGELTGAGDPNYKKQQSLGAVRPPLSIKVGDEWVSYAGLDPIAGQMAAAATAVEMSKGGGVISKETGMGMIIGMATALKNSSYAESLSNAMNMAVEGVKGVTGVKTGMTATANFAGSQAANLLTPAFVRWINQKFVDPAARDTTGDDSFGGRVMGRAISGTPGLSDNLPQKYDVYGRPMTNLRQPRYVETDPTVLELNRLEASTDKVLIGPVGPTVDIGDEKDVRLPSRIYQEYQKLAGEYILSDLRAEIEQPGWDDYTDEEKIEIIKETATNARKDARAELFGELEEGELDDTENGG